MPHIPSLLLQRKHAAGVVWQGRPCWGLVSSRAPLHVSQSAEGGRCVTLAIKSQDTGRIWGPGKAAISHGPWKKGLITELGWDNEEAIWGKDAAVCPLFLY